MAVDAPRVRKPKLPKKKLLKRFVGKKGKR
jgi:hypothetical protein